MSIFGPNSMVEAYRNASLGGQSLYVRRKSSSAWLIDHDLERLFCTAKRLGVRHPFVGRLGLDGQYVEVAGVILDRAVAECSQAELAL